MLQNGTLTINMYVIGMENLMVEYIEEFISGLLLIAAFVWPLIVIAGAVLVITYVMTSIGLMLILKKLGLPGVGAWVPFYNLYLFFKIGNQKAYWFWVVIAGQVLTVIPFIGSFLDLVSKVLLVIVYIYAAININKTFEPVGNVTGLTIFAVLLPPFWFLFIGLRDNKPKNVEGPVFFPLNNPGKADS